MNKTQRIFRIINGALLVLLSFFLPLFPEYGYMILLFITSFGILFQGLRGIVRYFTLDRYVVNGRKTLYRNVIVLDFGLFFIFVATQPRLILLGYLLALLFLNGLADILRFIELVRFRSHYWPWRLFRGLLALTIAALCIVFFNNDVLSAIVYGVWLLLTGVEKIVDGCRRTAMVYIQ